MKQASGEPKRFGHHGNAFGALRLLFASLVIVAHTPEIIDGDQHREILNRLTGNTTFGGLAVMGFFIISGYLITGSYLNSRTWRDYLTKRIARIYPGFIVAFVVCLLIVAPLSGAAPFHSLSDIAKRIIDCIWLEEPQVQDTFLGTHHPGLNGSMWTIAYEFRCYLLVILLGLTGLLRKRGIVLGLTVITLLATIIFPTGDAPKIGWVRAYLIGDLAQSLHLTAVFLGGASFYLYRDRLRYSVLGIVLASIGLVAGLLTAPLLTIAVTVCGGYLILAVSHLAGGSLLGRVNNENDISYGVYLYAWPAEKLLLWWWPAMPIVMAGLATFAIACAGGWMSWLLVEKPVMERIRARAAWRFAAWPAVR